MNRRKDQLHAATPCSRRYDPRQILGGDVGDVSCRGSGLWHVDGTCGRGERRNAGRRSAVARSADCDRCTGADLGRTAWRDPAGHGGRAGHDGPYLCGDGHAAGGVLRPVRSQCPGPFHRLSPRRCRKPAAQSVPRLYLASALGSDCGRSLARRSAAGACRAPDLHPRRRGAGGKGRGRRRAWASRCRLLYCRGAGNLPLARTRQRFRRALPPACTTRTG